MVDWSFVDADFFIRAGAGVPFVVLGVFMLAPKPRRPGTALLASCILLFGLGTIVRNFETGLGQNPFDPDWATAILGPGLYAVAAALGVLAILNWPEPMPLAGRRALLLPGLLAAIGFVTFMLVTLAQGDWSWRPLLASSAGITALYMGAGVLVAGCAEQLRSPANAHRAWPIAAVAVSMAILPVFNVGQVAAATASFSALVILAGLALVVPVVLGSLWLLRARGSGQRAATTACLVLLATTTAAMVSFAVTGEGAGSRAASPWQAALPGLIRMAGAAVLAFAIFRRDLLGVPLPKAKAHAGALASLFLIVLFALSQILQNFLNDSLGLILGGVVAGIVVFSAGPMERRFSRLAGSDRSRHEDAYRQTVRLALRDGRIQPDEERDLIIVASKLGVQPERAYAIRDEEEQALHGAKPRRRPAGEPRKGT